MKQTLAAILGICTLLALATAISAQVSTTRYVDVTVTDPGGRFVTGLDKAVFEVVENGVRRVVTDLSGGGSPLSLAIVSDQTLADLSGAAARGPEDELIHASSVTEALRQLALAKNTRKAIVITAAGPQTIPPGITALQVAPANLVKAVIELRNQYRLEFESSAPSANVEVVLRQPRGLPLLASRWK